MNQDTASTVAGSGAGLAILATVRWELIPFGEVVKVMVAISLILISYLMYRSSPPPSK